nr:unnamed protein product [Digitaria exilis]
MLTSARGHRVMTSAVGPADVIVDRSTVNGQGGQWGSVTDWWAPAVSAAPRLGSAIGPKPAMGHARPTAARPSNHEARPRDPLRQRSDPVRPAPCGQHSRACQAFGEMPQWHDRTPASERSTRSRARKANVYVCAQRTVHECVRERGEAQRRGSVAGTARRDGELAERRLRAPAVASKAKRRSFEAPASGTTAGQRGLAHGDPPEQSKARRGKRLTLGLKKKTGLATREVRRGCGESRQAGVVWRRGSWSAFVLVPGLAASTSVCGSRGGVARCSSLSRGARLGSRHGKAPPCRDPLSSPPLLPSPSSSPTAAGGKGKTPN